MSILLQHAWFNGHPTDMLIEGNRIARIADGIEDPADTVIDATGKAVIPGLINSHTHAAMTLFRGYGDDMELFDWLNNKIWPIEAKLTEEDVYWGVKLACLEMIKTGTTTFNDMYWHWHGTARAVAEMGVRACVAGVFIDLFDKEKAQAQIKENQRLFAASKEYPDRLRFSLGPHAIYTVSEASLRWAKAFADEHGLLVHIHLSETRKEVEDCVDAHGVRPVEYLRNLGVLGPNLIIAHAIWIDERELAILQEHDVKIVTNPCANMKLASGVFRYSDFHDAGLTIGIGTDGVGSNNNVDMFEQMKFTALVEKSRTLDPTAAPAADILACATADAADLLGIDAGRLEEDRLADILLIDLSVPAMAPGHNLTSDIVYAANGSVVDTVICDGRLLMRDRHVEGEEEIIAKGREVAMDLVCRAGT